MELLAVLRTALTKNLSYKLVSLLVAVILWTWVQTEQLVEVRVRAAVQWMVPEGLALVETPIDAVSLTVSGAQAFVRSLQQQTLVIKVDLSKAHEGDVSVDLSQKPVDGLPPQVRVVNASPSQLRVTLGRLLRRKVPVTPFTVGKVAAGYRVATVVVEPSRAELSGADSALRGMEAIPTEDIDLADLRDDVEIETRLSLRKGIEQVGGVGRFVVRIDVEPILTERTFAAVPVLVRDAAWSTETATVSVLVNGPQALLDGMSDEGVSVMVHIQDPDAGATALIRYGRRTMNYLEVVGAAGEDVRVVSVTPDSVLVTRKE